MLIIMRNLRRCTGGVPGRPKGARLKFIMRSLLYYPWTIRWLRYLESNAFLRELSSHQPQLLHKLHRPYLHVNYGIQRKINLLCSHYDFLMQRFPAQLAQSLSRDSVTLACWQGRGPAEYSLQLGSARVMDKEGELLLTLHSSTTKDALIRLAFSIVSARDRRYRIQIGCLQGPGSTEGRAQLKATTKDLHGLMPRLLAIRCIYTLARLLAVDEVVGVSNISHVHNSWTRRYHRIDSNYDDFWGSIGGIPSARGLYRLPGHAAPRRIEDVPSSKRAQYTRRKNVEADIIRQIEETFGNYCR